MTRQFNTTPVRKIEAKAWNFSAWFIAPMLLTLATLLVYMWATGQLDLWRYGVAS